MTEIKKRLTVIEQQIHHAEQQAGRPAGCVQLLAVSKTWPAEIVRAAAEAGQQRFGENYLQEALSKIQALQDLTLEWHFIGPVQSNKTRDIAGHFDWLHSLDRLKIAKRLNQQRPASMAPLNVCIQLNIDDETSKAGIKTRELLEFADQLQPLSRLRLRGLMIIPAASDDVQQQRATFYKARQLFEQLQARHASVDTLSMGMSADMHSAIAEGSTMVRIGTALFGDRMATKVKAQ